MPHRFLSLGLVPKQTLSALAGVKAVEKDDPLASGGQKGSKIRMEIVFLSTELSSLSRSMPTTYTLLTCG